MNPGWYLVSWFLNLLVIAVLVGAADKMLKLEIEEHKRLGAFFIFVLPIALEIASFFIFNRPFFLNFS